MRINFLIYFLGTIILLLIDRLTKFFVLNLAQPIEFGNWQIILHRNYGAVFGLNFPPVIIFILTTVVLFFIIGLIYKNIKIKHWYKVSILFFILLAGLSNFWDRIFFTSVIDIITAPNGLTFNLADIYLITGALLYIKSR
ncbi:MAG: signal peptidase II [Patescibacteria group bacterium]